MSGKMILQISPRRPLITGSSRLIKSAGLHFKKYDFVRLPSFFTRELLFFIREKMNSASFVSKKHKDIATELCMKTNALLRLLTFLMNDYVLFKWIDQITGCGSLGCFTGRIYRMNAGAHYDSWHDDYLHNRKIAISVNLSQKKYRGGCLMMRSKAQPSKIQYVPNTGFGDAVIFRLGGDLEHQVSPLAGDHAKTAYAGWFRSRPDYLKGIKSLRARSSRIH